jgi:hypothetical protein
MGSKGELVYYLTYENGPIKLGLIDETNKLKKGGGMDEKTALIKCRDKHLTNQPLIISKDLFAARFLQ